MPVVAANFSAVLFDLDGTLVDTAPDMAGALNDLRRRYGFDALPEGTLRPLVSHGSRALIDAGFDEPDEDTMQRLIPEFLDVYAGRVAQGSRLFQELQPLLNALERAQLAWGVVTNKPGHLAESLLEQLGLRQRLAALVCGDTLPVRKPHPDPLHHAARLIGVPENACVYVGDAQRDIDAGRAAGMTTVAAAYGYILADDSVEDWGADAIVHCPGDLHTLIFTARDGTPAP